MFDRTYEDFLQDILDAIKDLKVITQDITFDEMKNERKTYLAVERLFEIIGEAANRIPKGLQEKYSHIPWADIVGMRNIVIHAYDRVEPEYLWTTIKEDIPPLELNIQKMLAEIE